jgi:hypothetical protein
MLRPTTQCRVRAVGFIASTTSQAIVLRAVLPTLNISAPRQGATIRLIAVSSDFKAAKKYLILDASKVARGPPNQ